MISPWGGTQLLLKISRQSTSSTPQTHADLNLVTNYHMWRFHLI